MIETRTKIHELFKDRNIQIGAELGVANGWYSSYLNRHHKFKEFFCIDKWNDHHDDKERLNVIETFKNQDNVKILHMEFQEAINLFPDEYFDFIYIDTSHIYDQTKKELNLSFKKIKKNGIIAGHDYNQQWFPGVVQAVNEFAVENNLTFKLTTKDSLETFYFIL